jgi:UDP-glucose 4-epimerase
VPLAVKELPRRAGDPPAIVSNPAKLKAALGWAPKHDSLDEIVAGALAWESRLNSV